MELVLAFIFLGQIIIWKCFLNFKMGNEDVGWCWAWIASGIRPQIWRSPSLDWVRILHSANKNVFIQNMAIRMAKQCKATLKQLGQFRTIEFSVLILGCSELSIVAKTLYIGLPFELSYFVIFGANPFLRVCILLFGVCALFTLFDIHIHVFYVYIFCSTHATHSHSHILLTWFDWSGDIEWSMSTPLKLLFPLRCIGEWLLMWFVFGEDDIVVLI